MSVATFQAAVAEATGVPAESQELRGGFPPRPLALPAGDRGAVQLASLGVAAGDSITVTQAAGALPAAAAAAAAPLASHAVAAPTGTAAGAAAAAAAGSGAMWEDEQLARAIAASLGQDVAPAPALVPAATGDAMSEDEQLARAIAASLGQDVPAAADAPAAAPAAALAPIAGAAAWAAAEASASWAPLPDTSGRGVVRRKMEDDNSCLFSAVRPVGVGCGGELV